MFPFIIRLGLLFQIKEILLGRNHFANCYEFHGNNTKLMYDEAVHKIKVSLFYDVHKLQTRLTLHSLRRFKQQLS